MRLRRWQERPATAPPQAPQVEYNVSLPAMETTISIVGLGSNKRDGGN